MGTNRIQALIPLSLHCTIANNGHNPKSFPRVFGRSTNRCVSVFNTCWTLILSQRCQHPYANLLKLYLRFCKDLEMVSDKARSSPSQNHEQWLSKSMLRKYLKEVKRIKHLLDSKTVVPMYTCACEYLFLNTDKMPGSFGEKETHRGCWWEQAAPFVARDCFAGEEGADSGETQPPTGLWVPWRQQPALLTPRTSVLQRENLAQPIPAELLLTFMGYQ